MGYHQCPTPCDVVVPSVVSMSDVGNCLICLVRSEVTGLTAASPDTPTPPLGKDDGKCHGTIAKEQTKHLGTILKERAKCQNGEEKLGATDLSSCANLDPSGKIGTTRQKGEAKVGDKCGVADLTAVSSCATTSTTDLNACVFGDSDARGETLFEAMYGFGEPTWTAVQNMFIGNGCGDSICHGLSPGQGDFGDLGDYDLAYDELLVEGVFCGGSSFVSRVVAGDDVNSFLMAKLEGTQDCGSSMPLAGLALTPAQLELVRRWILDGAQKN
jgi:hypothetical protein